MSNNAIVVGFPKSGNTWLARLLGDVLNRPIRGTEGATPIAAEGEERGEERGIVQQLHLVPDKNATGPFVTSPWSINADAYTAERVIHVLRDPRDISVAINAYWQLKDLTKTITDVMGRGVFPLWGCGWQQYIESWRNTNLKHIETRYESLVQDTTKELERILTAHDLTAEHDIAEVVERQSFAARKEQINKDGDNMTYGKGIQRDNLRKGIVGDWRNVYTFADTYAAHETFGACLFRLGYEIDADWYLKHNVKPEFAPMIAERFCHTFSDPMINPRMVKSLGLYQLASLVQDGAIVELGTYHGNGAVSLASNTAQTVFTIDDYASHTDWVGNTPNEDDAATMIKHVKDTRLNIEWLNKSIESAATEWDGRGVGMVYWDTGDKLMDHFEMWGARLQSGGLFVAHDTQDCHFGSDKMIEAALARGWKKGPQLPMLYTVIKP